MKKHVLPFTLLLVGFCITGFSQATFTLDNSPIQALFDYSRILEDPEGNWDIQDAIKAFSRHTQNPNDLHAGPVYWANLRYENPTDFPQKFVISPDWKLGLLSNSDITLYLIGPQGKIDSVLKGGRFVPASQQQTYSPPNDQFILEFPSGHKGQLYFRLEQIDGKAPVFEPQALDFAYWSSEKGNPRGSIWAFFQGMFWILFAYALITYFFTKDKAYLFYAIYLAANSFYFLYHSGYFTQIFLREYPTLSLYFWIFFSNLLIFSYFQFGRSFVQSKIHIPKWDRVGVGIMIFLVFIMCVEWILCFLTFNEPLINLFINLVILLGSLFLLALIIRYINTPLPFARIFLWGSCFLVAAGLIGVILDFYKEFEHYQTLVESFFVGELLTFAVGLSFRLSLHQKEHQRERLRAEKQQELNALQSQFFTRISHEFRTPLTVIKGNSHQLAEKWEDLKLGEVRDRLDAIERHGDKLLTLVNKILKLSKLESGKEPISLKRVELIGFSKYILSAFDSYAKDKGVNLEFRSSLNELYVDMDPAFFQDILTNLLSNALKFTPEGGNIQVHIIQSRDQFQVEVQDSGIGIAPELLPLVFSPFQSRDSGEHDMPPGIGLGLALVKERVEALSGEIEVNSKPGKGAHFTLSFPFSDSGLPLWNKTPDIQSGYPIPTEPAGTYSGSRSDRGHVLIIDDHPDIRKYLHALLDNHYEISLARDGKEGIEKAKTEIPNLILCDIMMPGMDGYEVLKTLKEDPLTSHIPIVLLTAKALVEEKVHALQQGADAFLVKPPDEQELQLVLRNIQSLQARTWEYFSKHSFSSGINPKHRREHSFLQEAKEIVLAHLLDPDFGIDQLAEACHMKDYQLRRKLKALLNRPPAEFIRWIRLQEAQKRLLTRDDNISEVAYAVGFSDPNHFSRVFRKEFGCTPTEFRKQS